MGLKDSRATPHHQNGERLGVSGRAQSPVAWLRTPHASVCTCSVPPPTAIFGTLQGRTQCSTINRRSSSGSRTPPEHCPPSALSWRGPARKEAGIEGNARGKGVSMNGAGAPCSTLSVQCCGKRGGGCCIKHRAVQGVGGFWCQVTQAGGSLAGPRNITQTAMVKADLVRQVWRLIRETASRMPFRPCCHPPPVSTAVGEWGTVRHTRCPVLWGRSRVLLTHPGGGGLIQGPTHPEFWHTHRPTNVPPPPRGGGLTPTHPPTHPPTYPTETCNTEDQVFHRGEQPSCQSNCHHHCSTQRMKPDYSWRTRLKRHCLKHRCE